MKRQAELTPGITRITAPNRGPLTGPGTNTYILRGAEVMIVDPGPLISEHLAAINKAIEGDRIAGIMVTHSHVDHSLAAPELAKALRVPVFGFGVTGAGQSPLMDQLEASGQKPLGEGRHMGFTPDVLVEDGNEIHLGDIALEIMHTPGHFGNHINVSLGDHMLSGDLIMGWATSIIDPPDGDLRDFYASCVKVKSSRAKVLLPGHGETVNDPVARVDELLAHRTGRHAAIMDLLADGYRTVSAITQKVYQDILQGLIPAAERNVFAHLIAATQSGEVVCEGQIGMNSEFFLKM